MFVFFFIVCVIDYFSIVGAHRDKDGYIWITGRIDDLVNVSGHLLSTAEVESALIEHKAVAEAASVSHPHKIKGECIYCFVTLKEVGLLNSLVILINKPRPQIKVLKT